MAQVLHDVVSAAALETLLAQKTHAVVHFWAAWCEPCGQLDIVLGVLAEDHDANFIRVEAEEVVDLSLKYNVSVVPLFLFFKDGREIDRLEGADVPVLTDKVKEHIPEKARPKSAQNGKSAEAVKGPLKAENPTANQFLSKEARMKKVKEIVNSQPIMLLMKGNPDAPRCGFSSRVVKILQQIGKPFGSFDILSDEIVRQSAKEYSDWPSYPQLYIEGELIGGCDIIEEMNESGELQEILDTISIQSNGVTKHESLDEKLIRLINTSDVMLFMKGNPDAPRCGFSAKVVQALRSQAIPFKSFDILEDQEVREGLKKLSQWPTYPQLYAGGELLGGCDIILEFHREGSLKSEIQTALDDRNKA